MAARPGVHTPAVRHRAATMSRARELRAAGWSLDRICELLEREGVRPVPHRSTVWHWIASPEVAERYLRNDRERRRRVPLAEATLAWPGRRGPEWRLERMRRLRARGLGYRAIAAVMTLDFPDEPLTERRVRQLLAESVLHVHETEKAVA